MSNLKSVSHEQFVRTWQAAATKADVAQALGWTPAQVQSRRNYLVKQGVNLKHFSRSSTVDPNEFVAAWNAGATNQELASQFDIHPGYVYLLASNLRDKGYDLSFRKGTVDADALNALIETV